MTADVLSKVPTDLFIGGTWRAASEGGRFDVTDPATGEVIAQVADGSVDDGLAAVAAAAEAGPAWAATPPRQRAEILRKAWQLMTDRVDEIATLISLENGKALVDAKGEATYAAEFFRWYSEETVRIDGLVTTAPGGANRIMVVHQPVGVCVMVTPWNFPAAMATRKIGPALGAGCTVVLKPASDTPLTALLMAADPGRRRASPRESSTSYRLGAPAPIVSAMVHDDRVRKLSFTGSTEVGRVLLKEAADTVVNTSMELGGNAPFLVFADADLDAALEGAMIAKMRNGGEACTAANRFYVEESVAEEFATRLAEKMGAMKVGPGTEDGTQVGPLVNDAAVQKCDELVRGALAAGARALIGGAVPDRPGCYYDPTVLVDVPADAEILREEIFGPVAPIVTFTDEAEAVRCANDTEFGLVAYLYTERPGPRAAGQRGPGERDDRPQPRPRVGPGSAVRRSQAVRHRPRGRP